MEVPDRNKMYLKSLLLKFTLKKYFLKSINKKPNLENTYRISPSDYFYCVFVLRLVLASMGCTSPSMWWT